MNDMKNENTQNEIRIVVASPTTQAASKVQSLIAELKDAAQKRAEDRMQYADMRRTYATVWIETALADVLKRVADQNVIAELQNEIRIANGRLG